ncbi:MAG: response regulator [Candidatus Micrarchaeota archaeon]
MRFWQKQQLPKSNDGNAPSITSGTSKVPMAESLRKKAKVAIFDDVAEIIEAYSVFLGESEVCIVSREPVVSVSDALEVFRAERPDIVITDLSLTVGGTEGFDILDQIKAIAPEVPVVLSTSAYSHTSVDEICVEIRAKGYDAVFEKRDGDGIAEFVMSRFSS